VNVDAEINHALWLIELSIDARIAEGNREIDRTVAAARAWLRHWPNQLTNRRSEGQFLRHMRERNGLPLRSDAT
jgi:hypothetical protein